MAIDGGCSWNHYECSGINSVILFYLHRTDKLEVYMASSFKLKFLSTAIVDYRNDNFMMISGFSEFEWENLISNSQKLDSWKDYLSKYNTDVIVVLKKSIRKLIMYENNELINMKNFQNCKVTFKTYSISLDEVHKELMQLSKLL